MLKLKKSLGLHFSLLVIILFLTACGGGDSSTPAPQDTSPATTTVTGLVELGAMQVALFEHKSVLTRLASLFISDLQAAITGLTPVKNASVELIRIDSNGNQVGAVLATATTDNNGVYSLVTTETLSSNLVIQVTDNAGNKVRAIALSTTTDINPVTHYVVQKILASIAANTGYKLNSVTTETVTALVGFVEALPGVDAGTANFNDTISAIDLGASAAGIDTEVSNGFYTVNLSGRTATSVITNNSCGATAGGWTYTFTDTGLTMVGTDTFIGTVTCTTGAEETIVLTYAEVQAIGDIPFNCGSDNICTNSDLNKVLTGVDKDNRTYTSVYTHTPNTNTFTYVSTKSDGSIFTEVITLSPDTNIAGAWAFNQTNTTEPGMLVFYPNGFYIHWQNGSPDINCAASNPGGGVEYGTYTFDGITLTASQIVDQNASCGLSSTPSIDITITGGNLLTFPNNPAESVLPRVDGGPGSLVGAWNIDGSITTPQAIVFYDTGFYMHWQDTSSDPNCAPGGVEYGTYALNGTDLAVSTTVDETGECGLRDSSIGVFDFTVPNISVTGDVVSFGDGFIFDRL